MSSSRGGSTPTPLRTPLLEVTRLDVSEPAVDSGDSKEGPGGPWPHQIIAWTPVWPPQFFSI